MSRCISCAGLIIYAEDSDFVQELSWVLVFLTLCVQVLLITILCIPHQYLPGFVRRAIIRVFEEAERSPNIVLAYKITTALLLLLFLDAVRTINHLDEVCVVAF